jgi:twinkle protein
MLSHVYLQDYAVYVNDVEHIILDNLQFMLSRNGNSRKGAGSLSWDKFDAQDLALEKFRKFATERLVQVHVQLCSVVVLCTVMR